MPGIFDALSTLLGRPDPSMQLAAALGQAPGQPGGPPAAPGGPPPRQELPRLAARLRGLSERAGVPVQNVLVADASRRTTKVNAYVSGIGSTRRVVLSDQRSA